jgi:ribose 5-phosphate isomerase B
MTAATHAPDLRVTSRESHMKIAVSADHAGVHMKRDLVAKLSKAGHDVLDLGTHSDAPVDYPDCAEAVAGALREGSAERGVIVCGSGAGVSIAATKFPGIRAAVVHDSYTAHQAVEHDDMNVICMGARVIGGALAWEIVTAFLAAQFSGEERHARRLNKINRIEQRFSR